MYTDDIEWPVHLDGLHNYLGDSLEAQQLIENDQELPQDILDRLEYYKPIIDKQLEECK